MEAFLRDFLGQRRFNELRDDFQVRSWVIPKCTCTGEQKNDAGSPTEAPQITHLKHGPSWFQKNHVAWPESLFHGRALLRAPQMRYSTKHTHHSFIGIHTCAKIRSMPALRVHAVAEVSRTFSTRLGRTDLPVDRMRVCGSRACTPVRINRVPITILERELMSCCFFAPGTRPHVHIHTYVHAARMRFR